MIVIRKQNHWYLIPLFYHLITYQQVTPYALFCENTELSKSIIVQFTIPKVMINNVQTHYVCLLFIYMIYLRIE